MNTIKKTVMLVMFLTWSFSSGAFVFPLVRMVFGGALLTGAYYAAEETKKEYAKAQRIGKNCRPIVWSDFDPQKRKELKAKCHCYKEKYKDTGPWALATVVAGGLGARALLKGILK